MYIIFDEYYWMLSSWIIILRKFIFLSLAASLVGTSPTYAFGDYPLASCKFNNGTIIEKTGVNTDKAMIKGIVTKADIQEYCERDPGGVTRKTGGKLTLKQCVEQEYRSQKELDLKTTASCPLKTLSYRVNGTLIRSIKFPLPLDADTSCASGMPPLISQFIILCPDAAKRLEME